MATRSDTLAYDLRWEMTSGGKRPRKPRRPLPPVRRYVKPPRSGVYWKLGGPLTSDHEAEAKAKAKAAERRRRPGRMSRLLRGLGGRGAPSA
jgi:hypothetical protein